MKWSALREALQEIWAFLMLWLIFSVLFLLIFPVSYGYVRLFSLACYFEEMPVFEDFFRWWFVPIGGLIFLGIYAFDNR